MADRASLRPLDTVRRSVVRQTLREVEAWGASRGWEGTDPYEGLNATRLVAPLRRTALGRRVVIQAVKRSPVDLRPMLGIRRAHSSAALASVASSYARGGFLSADEELTKLDATVQALEALRCPGYDEPCWGYHFDVETRVFFYPCGAPNTIATSFAGIALLDAYERTQERRLLDLAVGAGDFFLRHVPQTPAREGAFFGYLVGDRAPIHNASLLVAALLARLLQHVERDDFRKAARAAVSYAVAHQRRDGSWPYGERPDLQWVDNFHTGYVLECLMTCRETGLEPSLDRVIARGLRFYEGELFLPDGTPRFFASATYPIDIQCAAQGIQTFSRTSALEAGFGEAAWRAFRFAHRRMRRRDGAFVFQRRRLWTNRTPHMRWCVAPMMLALTHLLGSEASPP